MNQIDPNLIYSVIEKLPLKEALGFLLSKKVFNLSLKGFGRIKELIQEKYNKRRFAFVPDKNEAKLLKTKLSDSNYRQIRILVPKYRYIDLLHTGLLIKNYREKNDAHSKKRVKVI